MSLTCCTVPVRVLSDLKGNSEDSLRVLQEELSLLGLPDILNVNSDVNGAQELVLDVSALTISCQKLCTLHRRATQGWEESAARARRLESDLELSRKVVNRTKVDLESAEMDVARASERERQHQNMLKKTQTRARDAQEEVRRCQSEMTQRDSHLRVEKRKLEQELDRLKERLHGALSGGVNGSRPASIHMLNSLQRLEGHRTPWARWSGHGGPSSEELSTVALRQLETRQEELLMENRELRSNLINWKHRLDEQLGAETATQDALLQLPFQMMKETLDAEMEERWSDLETRLKGKECVNQSSNQSVNQSAHQSVNQFSNQSVNQSSNQSVNQFANQSLNQIDNQELISMRNQLREYESLIQRQDKLLKSRLMPRTSPLNHHHHQQHLLESREGLEEEKSLILQQRSQIEAERLRLEQTAISLARDRKSLEQERLHWQEEQLNLKTPNAMDQSGCSAGNISCSAQKLRRNSVGSTQLTPISSQFTPVPTVQEDVSVKHQFQLDSPCDSSCRQSPLGGSGFSASEGSTEP